MDKPIWSVDLVLYVYTKKNGPQNIQLLFWHLGRSRRKPSEHGFLLEIFVCRQEMDRLVYFPLSSKDMQMTYKYITDIILYICNIGTNYGMYSTVWCLIMSDLL